MKKLLLSALLGATLLSCSKEEEVVASRNIQNTYDIEDVNSCSIYTDYMEFEAMKNISLCTIGCEDEFGQSYKLKDINYFIGLFGDTIDFASKDDVDFSVEFTEIDREYDLATIRTVNFYDYPFVDSKFSVRKTSAETLESNRLLRYESKDVVDSMICEGVVRLSYYSMNDLGERTGRYYYTVSVSGYIWEKSIDGVKI